MKFNIIKGIENSSIAKDIRLTVFVNEQGFVDEFDDIDDIAWHIELWDQGVPVAVGRMYESDKPGIFTIGRIAVLKEFRHNNIGKAVMEALEKHAQWLEATAIELSAQCSAEGFYEKLGYIRQGEVYLDQFCPHIKMVKKL